jgi:hypothetical protein
MERDRQLILKIWNEAIGGAYYNTIIKAAKYIDENYVQCPVGEFQDDY